MPSAGYIIIAECWVVFPKGAEAQMKRRKSITLLGGVAAGGVRAAGRADAVDAVKVHLPPYMFGIDSVIAVTISRRLNFRTIQDWPKDLAPAQM